MTFVYAIDIFSNFQNVCLFLKDEKNTKRPVVSNKHVFLISKTFCTLILASENLRRKMFLI